jgi:hypothetical protein
LPAPRPCTRTRHGRACRLHTTLGRPWRFSLRLSCSSPEKTTYVAPSIDTVPGSGHSGCAPRSPSRYRVPKAPRPDSASARRRNALRACAADELRDSNGWWELGDRKRCRHRSPIHHHGCQRSVRGARNLAGRFVRGARERRGVRVQVEAMIAPEGSAPDCGSPQLGRCRDNAGIGSYGRAEQACASRLATRTAPEQTPIWHPRKQASDPQHRATQSFGVPIF